MDKTKHQPSDMAKLFTIIKGFTLVELLVVIAIIGILASLSITSFQFILARAQDSRNKALAGTVGSAITQYSVDHNKNYPIASTDGGVDLSTLGNSLSGYLKTNAALTQATGVAKYMSSADGSSFAAVWELKYTNDPIVTTGNGVYSTNAASLAGAVNVPGILGNAVTFGGAQKPTFEGAAIIPSSTIAIPDNPALHFAGDFTVSFWFNTLIWRTRPVDSLMLMKTSSGPSPMFFRLHEAGWTPIGTGLWNPTFFRRNTTNDSVLATSTAVITDEDGWHHLVGIKNGSNISIIVDNSNQVTVPDVSGDANNNDDLIIGPTFAGDGSPYFNGSIDDLRIYNQALTVGAGSQVESLYNAGKGTYINPLPTNTVGHWRMDEGSGTTINNTGSSAIVNPPSTINGTLSNIIFNTWSSGIVPRFGFTGIGSSLLGKAFVVYGPQ